MPPGRPHGLDQPGAREELADLMVRGLSAADIGEIVGRNQKTIIDWRKDEEVQTLVARKRRERVNKFVSQIDTELEKRLEKIGDLSVAELLKIRQTVNPKAAERDVDPTAARKAWRQQDEATAAGASVPDPADLAKLPSSSD